MKKALILALLAGLTVSASAKEVQSLVGGNEQVTFSIKPEVKVTKIADETAELAGIQLAPAFGRKLYLGVGAYGLMNSVDVKGNEYDSLDALDFWYGGLIGDYTFMNEEVLHGSVGALIGGGNLDVSKHGGGSDSASLFVAEPNVNLMVNLTKTWELGVGLSYRYVNGSDFNNLENSDLSGPAGSIFLRWTEAFF